MSIKKQYIPAPLASAVKNGYVTDTSEILDENKGKRQDEINQETDNEISGIKGGSTKSIADLSEDIATEAERASGVEAGLRESIDELGQIGLDPDNAISTDGDDFDGDTTAKRSKIPTIGAIIDGNPGVYDVSKRNPTGGPNSDGKFTLEYILTNADTLIPTSRRHGGMEICFVHNYDNKYVQARLMSDSFNTIVTNWQVVDDAPTAGSDNLVKSGGVAEADLITEVKLSTKTAGNGLANAYKVDGLYINGSNKWSNSVNGVSLFVKVSPSDNVVITNTYDGTAYMLHYAFLTSPLVIVGNEPEYSSIIPNRQSSSDERVSITIPSDCYYLYIFYYFNNVRRVKDIIINDKYLDASFASIEKSLYGVDSLKSATLKGLDYLVKQGNLDINGFVVQSNYAYLILDLTIYSGSAISAPSVLQYGFGCKYTEEGLSWCAGCKRESGVPDNVTIPNDANYLYLLIGAISSYTIPDIYIDGNKVDTRSLLSQLKDNFESDGKTIKMDRLSNIVTTSSKNLINLDNVQYDKRYSVAQNKMIAYDDISLVATEPIEVEEGEWYVISGQVNGQGGYFSESVKGDEIGDAAIQAITVFTPVDGNGYCFQVPTGFGIKYVVITLTGSSSSHVTRAQLELGEQATGYKPYHIETKIKEELLPNGSGGVDDNALSRYTSFGVIKYPNIADKIENFRRHWFAKDKDLVVVNTGTSLTARSIEHCTMREDAAYRPPLMHSNNFASHIWDALKWEGQQYRRYDAKTEKNGNVSMFAETGSFQTQSNIDAWDDGAYRSGLTRYADGAASVAFTIPSNARQFNFIYRSDSAGSENCVVSVTEGNGKLQVWNGNSWVEANGYTFSMRESAVTVLPSITYKDPNTGADATLTNVQTKGNTTYQKRLKMRTVSRGATKTVTISSSSDRLLYWGVEWSMREYMITYINAARGSHNSLINNDSTSLIHYQDNEVWGFEPDLILSEDPIHNSGAAGTLSSSLNSTFFANVTENFFFDEDNRVSMVARCKELLGQNSIPEFALFNTSITYNFGGFNTETGELNVTRLADGKDWTALDAQMSCYLNVITNHSDVIYINAVKNFVDAAIACYGNLALATIGSGKSGSTFTNEGSHWNDTGCKVMARIVLPIIDFDL